MIKKSFLTSVLLHTIVGSLIYMCWDRGEYFSRGLGTNDYSLPTQKSEVKNFLKTEAQTLSQAELNKQILQIKEREKQRLALRAKEQAKHQAKLEQLKQDQKTVLNKKSSIENKIASLEKTKSEKSLELEELNKEFAQISAENDKQRKEQNKLK